MNRIIFPILVILSLLTAACVDELRNPYEIGEGEATVQANVTFIPLMASNVNEAGSRAGGGEIRKIRNIEFVIYDFKGQYIDRKYFGPGQFTSTEGGNTGMPSDIPETENGNKVQSEVSTATATATLPNLPYGRYKIYVVANYERLTDEQVSSPEVLKSQIAEWQDEISDNDQMFGCLAPDNRSEYGDAPEIIINSSNVSLQGWMKRLASKITIVYDGEELHQGINIYIKSVTVRDIPRTCTLGFDEAWLSETQKENGVNGNSPQSKADLIDEPANSSLYYSRNEKGQLVISSTDNNGDDPQNWLLINKDVQANNIQGAVKRDQNGDPVIDPETKKVITHPEDAEALYFYENCQGNYEGKSDYDKTPDPDDVGTPESDPSVYKDKVLYGTYIEVEGFYVSTNPNNQSQGPIKYRFMLGQNTTFNYNALRNRHYKLFLKFKGYANQPEWHIVYEEYEPGLYPPEYFYVSYSYNIRHEMPIRLVGTPKRVTLQIVENNWAPYDPSDPNEVAPKSVGSGDMRFQWYRELYLQQGIPYALRPVAGARITNNFKNEIDKIDGLTDEEKKKYKDATNFPKNANGDYTIFPMFVENISVIPESGSYHFGVHNFSHYSSNLEYFPAIPEKYQKQMPPPWVGFLALQVAPHYDDVDETLPTGVQDTQGVDNYSEPTTMDGVRDYYLGKGGNDSYNHSNTIPLYQCTYDFSNIAINGSKDTPVRSKKSEKVTTFNGSDNGRNAGKIRDNGDGSYTLTVPLFTQPKALGYISGFSGNNPYEGFRRKARVIITATYAFGSGEVNLVKEIPVYQVRRVVNPKAVWRNITSDDFHVILMDHASPEATSFEPIESEDEWSAWVATAGDEQTPYTGADFKITGGARSEGGKIFGNTGSRVEFDIHFGSVDANHSKCGKVIIKYHGNNCEHGIYLRSGYGEPLQVATATSDYPNPCKWSSYAVYSFANGVTVSSNNGGTNPNGSNLPATNIANLSATLTVNPLALGTLYKRGNYTQGIRIINNAPEKFPFLKPIGSSDLELIPAANTNWANIRGITVTSGTPPGSTKFNWTWSPFTVNANGVRNYDFPTYADYEALRKEDFGIGVLYGDGATTTALTTADAYQYFNTGNTDDQRESSKGMRGIIVYNKSDLNQVFFPIGYSGVGRRTIQLTPSTDDYGYLRYSSVPWRLSTSTAIANQYRPIAYNMPASPGAIYWTKNAVDKSTSKTTTYIVAWDINYFDLNFNGYDTAASSDTNGDALIIKPVVR